jgi:hypothetical protein
VQQAPQPVVRNHPVPDGVLLGSSQHGDRAGLVAIGGQRSVSVHVSAQDVREHQGVAGVGLLAGHAVAVAIARHGQWIDREHGSAGGA